MLCDYSEGRRGRGDVFFFDVALDLLKRHSGIVWDPGRFRGIAPRRGREEGDCGWALFGNRVAGKRPRGSQCILNTG